MPTSIENITAGIFRELSRHFPVVSASDEFFYFPQVVSQDTDWCVWDRFSPDFMTDFITRLAAWENQIVPHAGKDPETRLLKKMVCTLKEHLDLVRVWENQPTFYLTITSLGLAQAMAQGLNQARQRAETLPGFLDQAGQNLKNVPACFQALGMDMMADTRAYLSMLSDKLPELSPCLDALDRFEETLKALPVQSGFHLSDDLFSRVVAYHMHCQMSIKQISEMLDQEINDVKKILETESNAIGHSSWQHAYAEIPLPRIGQDGLVGLYRDEVHRLGHHCLATGLVSDEMYTANPVNVMPVPTYLSAIRAASSYSISPGHPPEGGIFYVFNAHDPKEQKKAYNREYRILAAHETWPGHHLLDINRWRLASPLIRAVEQPLFYEGWACFSELLLEMTGYIKNPADRLMVAKRRLWRAIRGKVDLGLQTGTLSLDDAADHLTRTGMDPAQARLSARKYLLNPGYQLCYTIGLRLFLNLYGQYGNDKLAEFSHTVLTHGEICFEDLEKILNDNKNNSTG